MSIFLEYPLLGAVSALLLLCATMTLTSGVRLLLGWKTSEKNLRRNFGFFSLILCSLNFLITISYILHPNVSHWMLPPWFEVMDYRFDGAFLINYLSIVYGCLSGIIIAVIVRFSFSYLHKEEGFERFFFFIALFSFGLMLVSYAGNFDILCAGWELIGLASVFLIAFFRFNLRSAQNSQRALTFYRLCDGSMIAASAWIHKYFPSNDFVDFNHLSHLPQQRTVCFLILGATLAKSAQLPFSTWLFRAVEGPTSSSAVFYGALSVHLGPFLLLRVAPLWRHDGVVCAAIGIIGLVTALYSTMVGRTRSDVKTTLAFATISQIGIIYIELALGLEKIALFHLVCHAGLRTFQYLRSSSLLQDFQDYPEIYARLAGRKWSLESLLPEKMQFRLYLHAVNGFYVDSLLNLLFGRPFKFIFRDRNENGFGSNTKAWASIRFWPLAIFLFAVAQSILLGIWFYGPALHKILTPRLETAVLMGLLALAFWYTGRGLAAVYFHKCLERLVLSQTYIIVASALVSPVGIVGGQCLMLVLVVAAVSLMLIVRSFIPCGITRMETYFGLAEHLPRKHAVFLLMGLAMIGIPGSLAFIAEDLIFHALLEASRVAVLGFIFITALNGMLFYKIYIHLFIGTWGSSQKQKEILPPDFSSMQWGVSLGAIFGIFLLGIWPRLLMLKH